MKWKNALTGFLGKVFPTNPPEEGILAREGSESTPNERTPELAVNTFKEISRRNIDNAVSFLEHRYKWALKDIEGEIPSEVLRDIIENPSLASIVDEEDLDPNERNEAAINSLENIHDRSTTFDSYRKGFEIKKEEAKKNMDLLRRELIGENKEKYKNFHFLKEINEDGVFEKKLLGAGIKCALLLTDTYFTRGTIFYKKIIEVFDRNSIPYVEFTNIQPELDRKLIFRINEFAYNHEVNSIVAIGSMSTVDISKILIPKLMKPNIIRLHKTREFDVAIADQYSIFSIPTFVVPDNKCNARSAVKNQIFLPNCDFFGNVLYLKNEIDDADGVFYCTDVFDILSKDKIKEALHEAFFKLIFCYFDLSAGQELLDEIIKNIHRIERLLEILETSGSFERDERDQFIKIISFSMDGRLVVDVADFWLLNKLEGALSLMVNSKKSDGLALFMPVFVEVMSERSINFKRRALKLGESMYGSYSIEGLVYRLSRHIKTYGLPTCLLDIEQVKKVDYKFLSSLLRKAKVGLQFGSLSKAIMKHVNIH